MRNIRKAKKAVSDVIGTILLLGMAVSLFSVLSVIVLSYPFEENPPTVNLIGYVDANEIVIEHRGGESLSFDTKIALVIDDALVYSSTVGDNLNETSSNNDNYWNLGEYVLIDSTKDPINQNILDKQVEITIIDISSNSIVLSGILQEAE